MIKLMIKKLIRIGISVIFVIAVFLGLKFYNVGDIEDVKNKARISVNNQSLVVDVVKDRSSREEGLSNRDSIGVNEGMLFIFDNSDYHTFWMKDMKFPIDIIWISGNQIVSIDKNVPPEPGTPREELTIYTPEERVDKVLEIKAGRSNTLRIEEGDTINFEPLISSALKINN